MVKVLSAELKNGKKGRYVGNQSVRWPFFLDGGKLLALVKPGHPTFPFLLLLMQQRRFL
jgi:hypothetical protein